MSQLLIVESPTKAKTIKKFIGNAYNVVSSFGHIRDLPSSSTAVDVKHDFAPTYEVPDDKKDKVAELKKAAKGMDEIYLATDEDREGEAIAWHIAHVLNLDPKTAKRITFHEITKPAIEHALKNARHIEMNLVNAQQARRILDRLVGYELSPFLWKKVRRGLSAGRVQSVAVRLVVEREREREAFKTDEFWTIDAELKKDEQQFLAKVVSTDGKKLDKMEIKTAEQAQKIVDEAKASKFVVSSVVKKEVTRKPPTPLTTSVLQMEANVKLGMSAKQTMVLAQKLYETGRITYMRTDSFNLAEKYLTEAQAFIKTSFGDKYATGPRTYTTKSKGAQEAHEAIRPTDVTATPELLKGELDADQWKLYNVIYSRTLASQMPNAVMQRTTVDLDAGRHGFRSTGSIIAFDGFLKVYHATKESFLPVLEKGDKVDTISIDPVQHFTEPPPRFSDASLIKLLEEHGIGRPSTYAPTISTIVDRGYIDRDDQKRLFPKDETAGIVTDLLLTHFPDIVDYEFTAKMEQSLDDVAEGKKEWVPMLHDFYTPFHALLLDKTKSVSRDEVMKPLILGNDPKTGLEIQVRNGRFGHYVQMGQKDDPKTVETIGKPKMASVPKMQKAETVTLEQALALLAFPLELGKNEAGDEVSVHLGPYGPYVKVGKKLSSIPPEIDPAKVTLKDVPEIVVKSAALRAEKLKPLAELGTDPAGKQIVIKNGRFGPYVTDGKTNASINKKIDPLTVTLEAALEILEKKRNSPKRAWRGKKKE